MTPQYKGYPIPEIMPDGSLFHIICDEGVFDGYSEEAVLRHWKNKVDSLWRLKALESGYVYVSDDLLGCPDCGLIAWDVYIHEKLHQSLTD